MLSPGLTTVAADLGISVDMVSTFGVGTVVLWTGIATFFTAAAASIWGKRPVLLASLLALAATNFWGFYVDGFTSFAAMRVFQGFASAPLETLVTSTISDLFFVHQRGLRLSIWGMTINTGVLLGQVISGYVITYLGFEYTFGICALWYLLLLSAHYLIIPETTYERKITPSNSTSIELELRPQPSSSSSAYTKDMDKGKIEAKINAVEAGEPKQSYLDSLAIFTGRHDPTPFWRLAIRPLPLTAYPAVLFSSFIYGTFFTWLQAISLLSSAIYGGVYFMSPAAVGLTNLPLLIAGLFGGPISGWMCDKVARSLASRNKGVYEPEFRLLLMIPALILSTTGFIGMGLSIAAGAPVQYPIAFQTLHSLSIPFASQASFAYVIDCHPSDANQALVTIGLFKAVLGFLASMYVNGWFEAVGAKKVFISMAVINIGFSILTVPMYIFGKRMRGFVSSSVSFLLDDVKLGFCADFLLIQVARSAVLKKMAA